MRAPRTSRARRGTAGTTLPFRRTVRTRRSRSSARRSADAASSAVLPMPGSPVTSTQRRAPARARANSSSSASRSVARPTKPTGGASARGKVTPRTIVSDGGRFRVAHSRHGPDAVPTGRDPALDADHGRRRLGAQLLGEQRPVIVERPERLGLAAAARQRPDEQATRGIAEGVPGDLLLEERNGFGGSLGVDQGVGEVVDRRRVDLGQAGGLALGPLLVRELLEWRAVPMGERVLEGGQPVLVAAPARLVRRPGRTAPRRHRRQACSRSPRSRRRRRR